jgi:hypothetical protein
MSDQIRYDLLVQDALRGVVRRVLSDTARAGLVGDHHYYVSLSTRAPGVRMSNRLREKYPAEMTIVLQHQFWDLAVTDHAFEVGLNFDRVPERLLIPFEAVVGFFDPSVQFGLKFTVVAEDIAEGDGGNDDAPAVALAPAAALPEPSRVTALPAQRREGETPAAEAPRPRPAKAKDADGEETTGGSVVSLDSFRKKK